MKKCLMFLSLILAIIMSSQISKAAGGDYIGDFCWNVTAGENNAGILKFGFFHLGGGHYLCSGFINSQEGPLPVHGNAELVESEIHISMTLANSQWAGANGNIYHCILDPSLNGTCKGVSVQAGETGATDIDYDILSLSHTSCTSF